MTDATQSDATQADADAQSQADTTSQTDNTSQADVKDAAAETISLDEAKKLRSESASLRKRLKDAEAAVQKFESANQTEAEKREAALAAAEERATKAEQRSRTIASRSTAMDLATKAGASSPRGVYGSILERYGQDAITYDDETGEPTNIGELIDRLKTDDPALFPTARGAADGGKTGRSNGYEPQPGADRIRHAYEEKDQAAKR